MTATTTRAAECWARILEQPDGMHMGYAADFGTDDGSESAEACAAVEAVAQQHLDAHPDDHKARRLLGEWLQWHGDVRGEGYRALAACRRWHGTTVGNTWRIWWGTQNNANYFYQPEHEKHGYLPHDWFRLTDGINPANPWWRDHHTRRAAENAAALAFARLPAERRAALLKGQM